MAAKHKPTDKSRGKVEALVTYGMPYDNIASELGITRNTLTKHYSEELEQGKPRMLAKVAQTLFRLAVGDPQRGVDPHPASCMFIMKCQAGWRETNRHEHELTGKNGKPIQVESSMYAINYDKLSDEAALELLEAIEAEEAEYEEASEIET